MPRLSGSVPLKFGGVVIGRAHIMQVDEKGLSVQLYLDDMPGMMEAIIAMVEIDQLPSMSFAFDNEPLERANDCAD